jgi:hypothetical protein
VTGGRDDARAIGLLRDRLPPLSPLKPFLDNGRDLLRSVICVCVPRTRFGCYRLNRPRCSWGSTASRTTPRPFARLLTYVVSRAREYQIPSKVARHSASAAAGGEGQAVEGLVALGVVRGPATVGLHRVVQAAEQAVRGFKILVLA